MHRLVNAASSLIAASIFGPRLAPTPDTHGRTISTHDEFCADFGRCRLLQGGVAGDIGECRLFENELDWVEPFVEPENRIENRTYKRI